MRLSAATDCDVVTNLAWKDLASVLRFGQRRVHADLQFARIGLRYANIDAHRVHVRHLEERHGGARSAGDERADIRVARGHHAVERCGDALEALQRPQAVHVGALGVDLRALSRGIAGLLVGGLL